MSAQLAAPQPVSVQAHLSAKAAQEPLSAGAEVVFMAAVFVLAMLYAAMAFGLYLAVGLLL
jgi:hypothetical protein